MVASGGQNSASQPVWVTGVGCLSVAGQGVNETRRTFFGDNKTAPAIADGSESRFFKIQPQSEWRHRFDFSPAGMLVNLIALVAADEALMSAGLTPAELQSKRVGICIGSTIGATTYHREFNTAYSRGEHPDPACLDDYFVNNTAQFLARRLQCRGPVALLNNACASGADAIGLASQWLRSDLCDIAICGGSDVILEKIYYGFKSLLLTSPEPCRPFDRERKGLTLGDGAAILILEKSGSSRRPQAQILGYGAGSDASHPTAPHPEARGLGLAVRMALKSAGRELTSVDFIKAHGTATLHNDLVEGQWIKRHTPHLPVMATKGYTGHTLGAAGAIEAVFAVLALQDQMLPPSRGFASVDGQIGVSPTREALRGRFETALAFSVGFGGANSALLIGRAP